MYRWEGRGCKKYRILVIRFCREQVTVMGETQRFELVVPMNQQGIVDWHTDC